MNLTQGDLLLLLASLDVSIKLKPGDSGWTDLRDKIAQEYKERFGLRNKAKA